MVRVAGQWTVAMEKCICDVIYMFSMGVVCLSYCRIPLRPAGSYSSSIWAGVGKNAFGNETVVDKSSPNYCGSSW